MLKTSKMLLFTGSMLFGSSTAFAACQPTDINGTWRFFISTERFLQGTNDEGGHRHEFARCRLIIQDGTNPTCTSRFLRSK
jgi:hypothetical protein